MVNPRVEEAVKQLKERKKEIEREIGQLNLEQAQAKRDRNGFKNQVIQGQKQWLANQKSQIDRQIEDIKNGLLYSRRAKDNLLSKNEREKEEYKQLSEKEKIIEKRLQELEKEIGSADRITNPLTKRMKKGPLVKEKGLMSEELKEVKKALGKTGKGRFLQASDYPRNVWQGIREKDRQLGSALQKAETEELKKNLSEEERRLAQLRERKKQTEENIKQQKEELNQKRINGDPYRDILDLDRRIKNQEQGIEHLKQTEEEQQEKVNNLNEEINKKKGYMGTTISIGSAPLRKSVSAAGNFVKGRFQNFKENYKQERERKKDQKDRKKEEKENESEKDKWERRKNFSETLKNLAGAAGTARDIVHKQYLRRMGDVFIFLALVVHLMKFALGFRVGETLFIDLAFALFIWFVIFENDDQNSKGLRSLIIILFLEIAIPLLIGRFEAIASNRYVHYYFANRLLTPWWFYFAIIWANNATEKSKVAKLIKIVVILFWIGVLLGSLPAITFTKMSPADYMGQQQTDRFIDFYHKSTAFWTEEVWGAIKRGALSIFDAWEKQMAVATGGYYTGMVDENSDKRLGVYIQRVRPTSPEFFYDSPVSVHGQIEIMSLADSVLLNVSCYHGSKNEEGSFKESQRATEVYPKEARWYYNLEKEQVDCIFEKGYLPRGSHRITVATDFNFETMAYQKAYFMNEDRMRALIGAEKDPLSEYGIKDKDPQARYTSGPVMIGMDVSNQPLAITNESNNQPRLGVTIESNTGWKGKIRELKELVVQVPDSMSLDIDSCNYEFQTTKGGNTQQIIDGFREDKSAEFESCIKEVGLSPQDFTKAGYIKTTPQNRQYQEDFRDCLQSKAEQEVKGKETSEEIVQDYKKYRSSQFRDCQKQAGLSDSMFNDQGYLKKDNSATESAVEFDNCLKEYAEKETEGYRTYYLNIEKYDKEFKNIERYKTFSCRINIDKPEEILNGRPIATHYFRAKARYDYQLEKDTRVQVVGSGAVDRYELPEGIEAQHMQIRRDYGKEIQESIDTINSEGDFNDKVAEILNPCLIQAQIIHESGGNPDAINSNDPSYGLMQIMKPTKNDVVDELVEKGISKETFRDDANLLNANDNILIGTYYLAGRIDHAVGMGAEKEDVIKYALAEYNHGLGNVGNKCAPGDSYVPFDQCYDKLPDITQNYVDGITESAKACAQGDYDKKQELPEEDPWTDSKWYEGQIEFEAKYRDEYIESYSERIYTDKDSLSEGDKQQVIELLYDTQQFEEKRIEKRALQCIVHEDGLENCEEFNAEVNTKYYEGNKDIVLTDQGKKLIGVIDAIEEITKTPPRVIEKEGQLADNNQKLTLSVPEQTYKTGDKEIRVKLMFNNMIEIGEETFTESDRFSNFQKNPFVKIRFAGCEAKDNAYGCVLEYMSAGNFIENSGKIKLDEQRALNSLLEVKFDDDLGWENSIVIKSKQGRKICTVGWPPYSKPKKCIDKDLPQGLGITIRDAFDERIGTDVREDYANIQIEYNINDFNSTCCSNPENCGDFALGTCNVEDAQSKGCIIKENFENSFYCADLMREVHS